MHFALGSELNMFCLANQCEAHILSNNMQQLSFLFPFSAQQANVRHIFSNNYAATFISFIHFYLTN